MCFINVSTSSELTRPYNYVIYILMYIQPCVLYLRVLRLNYTYVCIYVRTYVCMYVCM
jgi:hypothetical protein